MTPDEYFNDHIPHRVNLLIAFRQRYSGCDPDLGFTLDRERYRDLFRCAKDMSFLMVRFFFGEMRITLPKGENDIKQIGIKKWTNPFGIRELEVTTLEADPRFEDLRAVLKAANRAVAHLEDADVDHPFLTPADERRIFSVIDWTECLIKLNMYRATGRDLSIPIRHPNNDMKTTGGYLYVAR
jgi:hypothetical protein